MPREEKTDLNNNLDEKEKNNLVFQDISEVQGHLKIEKSGFI
jgi:hypothetical protein